MRSFFFFFFTPSVFLHSIQDLSSPTRDPTWAPSNGNLESLTTGPPGYYYLFLIFKGNSKLFSIVDEPTNIPTNSA